MFEHGQTRQPRTQGIAENRYQQSGPRQQSTPQTTPQGGQPSRQAPIHPTTVRDIAATEVVTTSPDAPVADATRKMADADVGAVVAVEGDRPVGIVTDRSVALAVGDVPDVSGLRVADLMSADPLTVSADATVFELARRFGDWGVRRAPVVDDRGALQGIVSLDDVVVVLAEEFGSVSRTIRKQSPRL